MTIQLKTSAIKQNQKEKKDYVFTTKETGLEEGKGLHQEDEDHLPLAAAKM